MAKISEKAYYAAPTRPATELELAYLAGAMDSDGSIVITRYEPKTTLPYTHPRHRLWLAIVGTNRKVVDLPLEVFGGLGYAQLPNSKHNRLHTLFRWQVDDRKAVTALEQLRPYLRLKEDQAWLALEFRANYLMHNPLRPEDVALRDGFYLALKQMKLEAMEGGEDTPRLLE